MKSKHLRSNDSVFLAYGADHSMVCCRCAEVHGFRLSPTAGGVVLTIWGDKAESKRERELARAERKAKKGAK